MPGPLGGAVRAIPSKSQAHRALICASLADNPTRIECEGTSMDIEATVACLSALGAGIMREQGGFTVVPIGMSVDDSVVSLPCGESGSTFRFMLPIIGALGRTASFVLEGRLPERPLSPLYEELARHGCTMSPQGSAPFNVSGRLSSGSYTLDAGVSSQFISGLLFALPLLDCDSRLRMSGQVESFPYIELTLTMLESFCVDAGLKDMIFSIPGGQKYRSPGTVRVEGDWSNAAFWLAAGAIGGKGITYSGLDMRSLQGDRSILDILKQFGAHIEQGISEVSVSSGDLKGTAIDAQDIPDLVPILAVVAAAAEGVTEIRNASRLRGKESDRLAAMASVLRGLGAEICETEDGLQICGGAALNGGEVSSWGDHRIVMAAAIASTICSGPVMIHGAEAVNKSYPGFFDDLRSLGGMTELI